MGSDNPFNLKTEQRVCIADFIEGLGRDTGLWIPYLYNGAQPAHLGCNQTDRAEVSRCLWEKLEKIAQTEEAQAKKEYIDRSLARMGLNVGPPANDPLGELAKSFLKELESSPLPFPSHLLRFSNSRDWINQQYQNWYSALLWNTCSPPEKQPNPYPEGTCSKETCLAEHKSSASKPTKGASKAV